MSNHNLNIPSDGNLNNVKVGDTVTVHVTADCIWCYSDPDDVFADGFLPDNSYSKGYVSSAYPAVNPGTVNFNTVESGDCDPDGGIGGAPHTITVSN